MEETLQYLTVMCEMKKRMKFWFNIRYRYRFIPTRRNLSNDQFYTVIFLQNPTLALNVNID